MATLRRTTLFVGVAVALLSAVPAWPEVSEVSAAPTIWEKKVGSVFFLEGTFQVEAGSEIVWSVLTDYEHIGAFVSSIRKSVVLERRSDGVLLEQQALARALFVSKEVHVLLDVCEVPGKGIVFQDISHSDFDVYEGTWNITQLSTGSRVVYRLHAKPRAHVPSLISADVFKATAADLLKQVRAEIVRRVRAAANRRPSVSG